MPLILILILQYLIPPVYGLIDYVSDLRKRSVICLLHMINFILTEAGSISDF